ncbi:hypothetical protein CMK17_21875 [Candidatus Poribacteria bacterium]|jgi:hypothetical protein|nr:hypothetical protein [Candidatus Poribacteria bacterium]MDP7089013.1 hypothetical protein [Dehalococcoidia bacterium]|tara:strand:- start:376 stop:588 length:213 start_codon:yes stop_codon:yes gene_type:complete
MKPMTSKERWLAAVHEARDLMGEPDSIKTGTWEYEFISPGDPDSPNILIYKVPSRHSCKKMEVDIVGVCQ